MNSRHWQNDSIRVALFDRHGRGKIQCKHTIQIEEFQGKIEAARRAQMRQSGRGYVLIHSQQKTADGIERFIDARQGEVPIEFYGFAPRISIGYYRSTR